MKTHLFFAILLLALPLTFTAFSASSNVTENQAIKSQILALDGDKFTDPTKKLDVVTGVLNSYDFGADTAFKTLCTIMVIEAKLGLGRFSETKALIADYLPIADSLQRDDFVVRLLMSDLAVADANNNIKRSARIRARLLELAEQLNDLILVADIQMAVGYSQYLNNENYLAVENFERAYETYKTQNFEYGLGSAYNALANVYSSEGDKRLSLSYFEKALAIFEANQDELTASVLLYNIALVYTSLDNESDQAIAYLKRSMAISEKLQDTVGLAYSQYSLAFVYLELKQFKRAKQLLDTAAEVFKEVGELAMYYASLLGLIDCHLGLGEIETATKLLVEAETYEEQYENPTYPSYILRLKARHHYHLGQYQAAYQLLDEYTEFLVEFNEQQRQERVDALLIKFDSKQKQAENTLLIKENELQELRLEKQQSKVMYSIVFAVVVIVILIVIAYLLYIQTQNRNRYQHMALRDHLTSAPNRRAILQYAKEKFLEAQHTGMAFTVAIIDLDHFKKFNDKYGHDVGDEVLVAFATSCRHVLRKQDRFGRYGGEEWLLVLSDTNKNEVDVIFNRLRTEFNTNQIEGVPSSVKRCFSMGVAEFDPEIDSNVQSMINRADDNLYKAKDLGRDQVVQ